jgi:hypothetical protein
MSLKLPIVFMYTCEPHASLHAWRQMYLINSLKFWIKKKHFSFPFMSLITYFKTTFYFSSLSRFFVIWGTFCVDVLLDYKEFVLATNRS